MNCYPRRQRFILIGDFLGQESEYLLLEYHGCYPLKSAVKNFVPCIDNAPC